MFTVGTNLKEADLKGDRPQSHNGRFLINGDRPHGDRPLNDRFLTEQGQISRMQTLKGTDLRVTTADF
ncbi:MAG: hypothetical protein LBQ77_05575 [Treponema sp.]|jgi:hypothetical protein|nr:hypothetical protein [Treponema sp.]